MKLVAVALIVAVSACTPPKQHDAQTAESPKPPLVIPAADVQTPIMPPRAEVQVLDHVAADPVKPPVSADTPTKVAEPTVTPSKERVCIGEGKCRVLKIHKKYDGKPVPK